MLSLLALAAILVTGTSVSNAADYVIAVDISGSMRWDKEGKRLEEGDPGKSRIEIIRPALLQYVSQLPDESRVYLISFNSGVVSEKEFVFSKGGQRQDATEWIAKLEPPGDSQTHLWSTLRRCLLKAREYAAAGQDKWVNVRIITDGENDHPGASLSLADVLRDFPEIPQGLMKPDIVLLGSLKAEFVAPIQKAADKDQVTLITGENFEDPLPPIINWLPRPVVVGTKTSILDASQASFASYEWFVDGEKVSGKRAFEHVFQKPGAVVVEARVKRKNGSADKARGTIMVVSSPIRADFHVPARIVAGEPAEFVNRSEGAIESYEWLIAGKKVGDAKDLRHIFDAAGDYLLVLKVQGKTGQLTELERSVLVEDAPAPPPAPMAAFRVVGDTVKAGEAVQLMDDSSGLVSQYKWEFGDGEQSSDKNPVHAFDGPGTRKVLLTVSGPGGSASAEKDVKVVPKWEAPTIGAIRFTPEKPVAPVTVHAEVEISGDYERVEWDLGGLGVMEGVSVEFEADEPGDYEMKVRVWPKPENESGAAAPVSKEFSLKVRKPFPGWLRWLLLALGLVAALLIVWNIVRPKKIAGLLSYAQPGGEESQVRLSGTSYSLVAIGAEGYEIKNLKSHGICLCKEGIPQKSLKHREEFYAGPLVCRYIRA